MNKLENKQTSKKTKKTSEDEIKAFKEAEQIINNINMPKHKHNWHVIFALIIIIAVLFLGFSTIFALTRLNNETIINGVFIENIELSNLTKEEAKEKVKNIFEENLKKQLTLEYGEYKTTISPDQLHVSYNLDQAIEKAYSYGHSNNIFKNNYTILNALLSTIHIKPNVTYDPDLLTSTITQINVEIPGAIQEPGYSVDGTTLCITNGKDGLKVIDDDLKSEILFVLSNIYSGNTTINIPVENKKAEKIDIDKIYQGIHKEPVNAYYQTNPYVVYPSSTGLDFNISIEDAKNMIATYQEQYIIPLKILYPEVSTNDIGMEAFPDLLSEFTTNFSSSSYSRATNIELASAKINGTVLMPGETFSYNQTVGQRTAAAGFKSAPAYMGGKVVQEIGGGICQVSSTLYNAVLYANLEIVERANHGFKPSYVKPGLDATVSWGGPDFKFKNNRNYPIKIVTDASGRNVRIYIYGLKTDSDLRVVLDAQYLSTVYARTVYEKTTDLAPGEERVMQSASNGCKTATYKYLYDSNNNLVSSECISRDTYNPHNRVIAVGQ